MKCPYCNAIMETNTPFCGSCGSKIDTSQPKSEIFNDSTDAINDFLSEMEGKSFVSETPIVEKTEAVFQDTKDRLFLDDNEDDEDGMSNEEIVNKFFDDLNSIEEDAHMELNKDYVSQKENKKTIQPVFETIPEEEPVLESFEPYEDSAIIDNNEDDYSDIVIGANNNTAAPILESFENTETSISAETSSSNTIPISNSTDSENTNDTTHTPTETNVSMKNNDVFNALDIEETLISSTSEVNEPHIFIDERPDSEQENTENTSGDFNVNIATDYQTPYLDSFINKPDINIDFEDFTNNENKIETSSIPTIEKNVNDTVAPFEALPPIFSPSTQNETQIATTTETPKSTKGIFISIAIIVLLLIGVVTTLFLFKDKLFINSSDNNTETTTNTVIDETTTPSTSTENTETTAPTQTNTENINSTETTSPADVNSPDWKIIKNSSLDKPLIVGDATIVKRYLDDTKTYENLQMQLSKVYRGEEATNIAKEYENNSTVKFETPGLDVEYVVVEYKVFLPNTTKTNGTYANLPIKIRGIETEGVIHNDNSYAISTWCINDGGVTTGDNVVTCQEIFQMPVGCTNYFIVFGVDGHNPATYRGQ